MKQAMLALVLAFSSAAVLAADKLLPHPYVEIETTLGNIKLELDSREAPKTVAHFIKLVDDGFYDGLIFHRVIAGFMIQAGGYTPGLELREDESTIPNESGNSMSNRRGTIAMARTNDPHSANSQFFINLVDNSRLDPQKTVSGGRWGYTVFGYVVEGMQVVDEIAAQKTGPQQDHANVPIVPVVIKSMKQVEFE